MKRISIATAIVLVLGLTPSCVKEQYPQTSSSQKDKEITIETEGDIENDYCEYFICFDEKTAEVLYDHSDEGYLSHEAVMELFPATKTSSLNCQSIASLERVFPYAGEWEPRHREAGLHKFYKAKMTKGIPATKAQDELGEIEGVESIDPVHKPKLCKVNLPFNDPYAKEYQWHLYNDGSLYKGFVSGCDINVVPVWKKYTGGSSNVLVAVVDQGIEINHSDLKGMVLEAGKDGSKNFVSNNYSISAGDHGTHVAGLIGGINNNGIGICGVAGGLDGKGGVKMMSCQVFSEDPKTGKTISGNMADAIVWGADHGAVISQNSWGYEFSSESEAKNAKLDQSLKKAIDYFVNYAGIDGNGNQIGPMKGGIVIFAAGNDNWKYGLPGSYSKVLSVGATGPDGLRASYSNHGDWVDICAPGGEYDRFPNPDGVSWITSLGKGTNGYTQMCGTSMACPLVSGVAALIVSHFGGPGFTNENLWKILTESANTSIINPDQEIGGMVDAGCAFDENIKGKVQFKTDYTGDFTIASGENLTVSYSIIDENGSKFNISLDGDGSATLKEKGSNSCTITFDSSTKYVGSHQASLKAVRSDGSGSSITINYKIYVNQPPVINYEYKTEAILKWYQKYPVSFSVQDPEGRTDCTVSISCKPEACASLSQTEEGRQLILGNGKGNIVGACTVTLTATDWLGASSSVTLNFTIKPNSAPELISPFDNILFSKGGEKITIPVKDHFYDPDEEYLSFSTDNSDATVASVSGSGDDIFIRSSGEGLTEVTLTAKDGLGKTCSSTFKIGVYNDAKGPSLFPNPVTDFLNVRIGKEKEISISIFSEMGVKVLEKKASASIFNPMKLDLSSLAPGRYKAKLTVGDSQYEKEIIKL